LKTINLKFSKKLLKISPILFLKISTLKESMRVSKIEEKKF
jgi:hypothetical protein